MHLDVAVKIPGGDKAAFEKAGGRDAVFYVVPVLGAIAIVATYKNSVS